MKLATPNIQLVDTPLTPDFEQLLLASPSAMSAFIRPVEQLPASNYISVYNRSVFAGAVHIEDSWLDDEVTIHPMLLERDRAIFTEVTEAAILWCLNNHLIPTAQVLDTPEYSYMHKFLESLGMACVREGDWRVYLLPGNWKPRSFVSYTMEFAT
jgi:hypothetical protein